MTGRLEQQHIVGAYARGYIHLATAKVAKQTGYSESSIRKWIAGEQVSAELDAAVRRALGETIPLRAAKKSA